jgi:Acetyltransferase (GNAT) domain
MGHIRPFTEEDVAQVARLHRAAFELTDSLTPESYREWFGRVFLADPAGDGPPRSLVYEEGGRVLGFLGLVSRRLTMNGRRLQALVSSQFVVEPSGSAGLVALRLVKAYLEGPQDLSIADEANDASRKIWEGLGGTTARLLSIHWTRPLRPAGLALAYLRGRRGLAPLAAAARPIGRVADVLAERMPGRCFRPSEPAACADDLCAQTAVAHAPELQGTASLRVEYDARGFQGLLDRAASTGPDGRLLKAVLRKGHRILGWYVCHLDREGVAQVLLLAATPSSVDDVLAHLFHRSWRQGAVAVTGRLEPRFLQALSDGYCLFHRRGPWMLIHARRPQLLEAFHAGEACFSPLDGEWSLRLRPAALKSRMTRD